MKYHVKKLYNTRVKYIYFCFRTQRHPVTKLFTSSLVLEFIALCFNVVHAVKYAADGVGFAGLAVAGDILDIMSRVSLYFKLTPTFNAVSKLDYFTKP